MARTVEHSTGADAPETALPIQSKTLLNGTTNGITNGTTNGVSNGGTTEADASPVTEAKADPTVSTTPEAKEPEPEKKPEPEVEEGSIGSVHNIYQVKGEDGEWTWSSKLPENIPEPAENDETAKYAVVLRNVRSSSSRRTLEAHSVIIQSPWLKKVLGDHVLDDYPGVSCELTRLEFSPPFVPFVHRWPKMLECLARPDLDKTTKEHLTILVDILKNELRDDIKAYDDYLSKGITTYAHAWMLFQPGSLVVASGSVYELQDCEYRSCNGVESLFLDCEIIDWGGSEFGRRSQTLRLRKFKGVEKITDLAAYPLSFHEDQKRLKKALIQRGKKFESLAGYHYKSYEGIAITWDREGNEQQIYHNGRIVVDCESFNRYSPYQVRWLDDFGEKDIPHLSFKDHIMRPKTAFDEPNSKDGGSNYILSDYFKMLCYNRVRGYSIATKQWLDFFVQNVSEVTFNTRAFDSLVLPEDQKELILAFTESQVDNRSGFDDVVKGKGQGIIILLSGKPGIGKTLTAESVAESMQRPLHTISSGDLGTDAYSVERALSKTLALVGRWNAVLLLDECDVFLEARSNHDLERNALVSTFLRTLEYYDGILFLTTNRADNIDQAFESRIHVSMQYPDLTASSRKRIWSNFLKTQKHALRDEDLNELAEIDLNGRQIKNIIKTSHLLASRKKNALCMKDIEVVLAIENRRPEKMK